MPRPHAFPPMRVVPRYKEHPASLPGGTSNIGRPRHYDRVFTTGPEPAPGRTIYGGATVTF